MSRDLLIEVGCEEIPAGFVGPALEGGEKYLREELEKRRVPFDRIEITGTPRRLVYKVCALSEEQTHEEKTVLGPPEKVAFDDKGMPTKAAIGFASSSRMSVEELKIFETERGRYVGFQKKEETAPVTSFLPKLLSGLLPSIPFRKSMRWADLDERFARPIHWIVALFGKEVIKFSYGNVNSGNSTFGHRFLKPGEIILDDISSYEGKLQDAFVVVSFEERKEMIRSQLREIEEKIGYRWIEDEGLLETVTNLVEYPVTVVGRFEESYLELPREILITTMKENQKYFVFEDERGNLFPGFGAVSNIVTEEMDTIIRGNERVLRARLSDADFYYRDDLKVPLIEKVDQLKGVVYQSDLGSYFQKTKRVEGLARTLASWVYPEKEEMVGRAALLAKTDLVTGVVYEFPELQGVIGRDYAEKNGEEQEVADAVFEHYLPRGAGDILPETETGVAVSIADKVDTICGCFGVGLIPTGTQDPYALRRQAIGVLHIIIEKEIDLSLGELIRDAVRQLGKSLKRDENEVVIGVSEYFRGRLNGILLSEGADQEVVEAVLNAGYENILDVKARVAALSRFKSSEAYDSLITGFKRAQNIIRGAPGDLVVSTELFAHEEEGALFGKIEDAEGYIQEVAKERAYYKALERLASLREAIDLFFEKVLVMDKNNELKRNRLALLSRLTALFNWIADFSKSGK